MTTRRVAHGDDTVQIQLIGVGNFAQVVRPLRDIKKCIGPTAASVADPPELEIPNRHALRAKLFNETGNIVRADVNGPGTAVEIHDNGPAARRWSSLGDTQVAKACLRRRIVHDPLRSWAMGQPSFLRVKRPVRKRPRKAAIDGRYPRRLSALSLGVGGVRHGEK